MQEMETEGVATPILPDGWFRSNGKLLPGPSTSEEAVRILLRGMGEDPDRNGLLDTPKRVVKMFQEMTAGYSQDPKEILGRVFEEPYDEMVILRDIPFNSLCEHHLAIFLGTVDIGYIPGKVVGISKLARLVECFSQRLQIQERLTRQVAESIQEHLEAKGVAVVVRAAHSCLSCRGIRKSGAVMVTSCCLGVLRDKPEARAEFLSLCQK